MRVLLISPKFPPSFWSFPKTCELSGSKALIPSLGLLTVAALLPAEWELKFVDLNARTLTEKDWRWADLVMLSGMIAQFEGLTDLIQEAGRRGKTSVIGGPAATAMPDKFLGAGCDYVVRGEGENTVPLFLEAFSEGKSGIIIENGEKPDMTASPVPRFDLLNLDDYDTVSIQTSRGCPFDCEFCDVVNLFGRTCRYKTAGQVIEELEALYRLGARGHVFISDDNFIGNKAHALAVLQEITRWMKRRPDVFWFMTQVSVNLGQDLEMIRLMTDANFVEVFVGIESPDEEVLARNRKYQNIRNPLIESLDTINKNGLSVLGSFIIGLDGERKGAGERICAFVEQANLPIVMVNLLQAAPHTRLWNRLKDEGRLFEDRFIAENTLVGMFNYVPDRPESEILEEYCRVWEYLYEPSRFLARSYRYFRSMPPEQQAEAAVDQPRHSTDAPPPKRSFKAESQDAYALLNIVWRHGILASYRLQFWKGLIGLWKHNQSRMKKYLVSCAIAMDMFDVRDVISKNLKKRECGITH
ncbi:MAG: B12-binding domain-containing radical SAM protein [Deltaproteobacteria bacterium]